MRPRQKLWAAFVVAGLRLCVAAPDLHFSATGRLKISLFSDLHFGDSPAQDAKSVRFEEAVLGHEEPDLVVFMGDVSSGYAVRDCKPDPSICVDFFRDNWQKATGPLEKRGTPHTLTMGNHDAIPWFQHADPGTPVDGFHLSPQQAMGIVSKNSFVLGSAGPENLHGVTNFVVPVGASEADASPRFYLWHLDTNINDCLGKVGHGCAHHDQVEWYKATSERLKRQDGRAIPGMMFIHIPLPELNEAWNDPQQVVNGSKGEEVCCSSVNTKLFEAVKDTGNVVAIFNGHDHKNDFAVELEGILLAYGRKSGYGGYSSLRSGSRMIEVILDDKASNGIRWDTWITLETGQRIRQQPTSRRKVQRRCAGMREDPVEPAVGTSRLEI
eukprot:TRINITY_DN64796_c0_g1_i1.p1 TRINITY_DN64796_c0_g1~~TRINITY_DN64796_c0_g1_i1.p1  ORF type:complete len:383 (+),score=65.24 TRINITY_DN64796_c0_g1_i1:115-1263(+)